ncbi:MAG: metalloregulator ArsR/SmtB family transcription factor [Sphingobium sp.]
MTSMLDIFRALADLTRLRIVHLLRAMELSVGEVAQLLAQSQPRVSRHIRILVETGIVERRKEGNWVFLRIGKAQIYRDLMALFDGADSADNEALWLKADLARLAAVRADRARAADLYFARHAEEWDAIRSLYVAEAQVEAAMQAIIGAGPIGRLLDIGTGTGRMLQLFGPQASQVTAIDRSPDMLRLARAKLPEQDADKYALVLGDFSALPFEGASADLVIVHQVLHYAQAPDQAIAEAARVLADAGRLLVADFAPHEREDLRVQDQHTRLGFSDGQISEWFAAAGLTMERLETLPGGELTVKLWLGRRATIPPLPIKGQKKS